jgi:GST-like protein
MLKFYFNGSPNPTKVALFLEETGLPFEPHPIDIRKGEQFSAEMLKVNPNGKVPAIVDGDKRVFDSNAILLYLAEKTGKFLPAPEHRGEALSWLMFVASGIGPYCGQAVHFVRYAPEKMPYPTNRYLFEVERHFGVLDKHLEGKTWIVGDTYSIVDMAAWGWARLLPMLFGQAMLDKFPNVKRLVETIEARPAAQRAVTLKDRYTFRTETDDEAKRHMFKHLERTAG